MVDEKALADVIAAELDIAEMVLTGPLTLRRLKAERIARAVIASISSGSAELDDGHLWDVREAIGKALDCDSDNVRPDHARNVVATVLQALSPGSTGETEGWRDIGSAPKDRPVLLTAPGGQIGVCVWGGRWLYYGLPNKPADWWDAPTHWRPLPAPPSAMLSAAGER